MSSQVTVLLKPFCPRLRTNQTGNKAYNKQNVFTPTDIAPRLLDRVERIFDDAISFCAIFYVVLQRSSANFLRSIESADTERDV